MIGPGRSHSKCGPIQIALSNWSVGRNIISELLETSFWSCQHKFVRLWELVEKVVSLVFVGAFSFFGQALEESYRHVDAIQSSCLSVERFRCFDLGFHSGVGRSRDEWTGILPVRKISLFYSEL